MSTSISQTSIAPAECSRILPLKSFVSKCHNLHLDQSVGRLRPWVMPAAIANYSSTPTIVVNHPKVGRIALFTSLNRLDYLMLDVDGAQITTVAELSASVHGAYSAGPLSAVLLSRSGHIRVNLDADSGIPSIAPSLIAPPFAFRVESQMQLPISLTEAKLSGSYSTRSSALNASDARQLTSDLLQAYADTDALAHDAGYRIQPVLARYRIVDANQADIYISNPTLLCASDGFQGLADLQASLSDDFAERLACSGRLNVFRAALYPCFDAYDSFPAEAASIIIELSQPLCSILFDAVAPNAISSPSTNKAVVSFRLPGLSAGMSASTARAAAIVNAIMDHSDICFSTVSIIHNPASIAEPIVIDASSEFSESPSAQVARLAATFKSPLSDIPPTLRLCSLPHSYTAGCCCASADLLLAADLQISLFDGYKPQQFFAATTDASWVGAVTVEMADGSSHVATASGSADAPSAIAPLLYYPSPDAVRLTISYAVDGVHYSFSAPLTPSRDGSAAFYLHPSLAPFSPDALSSQFALPIASGSSISRPSALVIAPLSAPSAPYTAFNQSCARIVTIADADRSKSSYNYTNRRFFALSEAEISTLTISTKGTVIANERTFSRGLKSPQLFSATTDPRYPAAALIGSQLIAITRSGVSVIASYIAADAIAWNPDESRLWLLRDSGVEAVDLASGNYHTLYVGSVSSMLSTPQALLLCNGRQLFSSAETPNATSASISYDVTFSAPSRTSGGFIRSLRRIEAFFATADDANLSILLFGSDSASNISTLISTLCIIGRPASPIHISQLPVRRFPFYRIRIQGSVSSQTEIGDIVAFFD